MIKKINEVNCVSIDLSDNSKVDYQEIAVIANASFHAKKSFTPEYFQWVYEKAFGSRTVIFSAYHNEFKIGQGVALRYVFFDEDLQKVIPCLQLIDFFILPSHRGIKTIKSIYGGLLSLMRDQDYLTLTMPNRRSERLNQKFLNLKTILDLDMRLIPTLPLKSKYLIQSGLVSRSNLDATQRLLGLWQPVYHGSQIFWDQKTLLNRLARPDELYGIHLTKTLLGISVKRQFKKINVALICGLLKNGSDKIQKRDVEAIIKDAAYQHKTPFIVYIGHNSLVDLPGFSIPQYCRPSLMRLQSNVTNINISRFELIDFDFV